jgi:peptidoglycan/xylan/chitin deacetylase (PgdA/CDA1 family)
VLVLLALLAGCGVPSGPIEQAPPAPVAARSASDAQFTVLGKDYYNSRNTTQYLTKARIQSTNTVTAFARYAVGPIPVGEQPQSFTLTVTGTMAYTVGYINWTTGSWVWTSSLSGTQTIQIPAGHNVLNPSRKMYLDVRPNRNKRIYLDSVSVNTITPPPPPIDPPAIEVAKWQGDATAAISLSFDDATPDHWEYGMPLWEDYGYQVTLGIMTSRFTDEPARWPQLQEAFDAGHELANHTHLHQDLTTIPPAEAEAEWDTATDLLLEHVDGLTELFGGVYPYTNTNATVSALTMERFLMARGGDRGIADTTPLNDALDPDFENLLSYAPLNTLPMWQWNGTVDDALATGNWLIEQCHGIGPASDPDRGWSPRSVEEFSIHYDYIESFGDAVWVAPIGTVGRFIMERNAAVVDVLAANEGWVDFEVTDGLDDATFIVPLTMLVERPAGWDDVTITQDGAALNFTVDSDDRWRFDVLPDGGTVRITNNG